MIRRYTLLPLAVLALTGLSACGKEDPFEDKTYTGCLDADSITFHADGKMTATVNGQEIPEEDHLAFEKISDIKAKLTTPRRADAAYAELLEDGTLNITVPTENISEICQPQE